MANYTSMLAMLQADLRQFIAERDALQGKIERIAAAIKQVEILAQELDTPIVEPPPLPPDEEKGFTDKVREILRANYPQRLTAIEIRDVLAKADPKGDSKIMLIHTHNTLKRLFKQNEVMETQISDGRSAYQWKHVSYMDELGTGIGVTDAMRRAMGRDPAHRFGIGARLHRGRTVDPPPGSDPVEDAMKQTFKKK